MSIIKPTEGLTPSNPKYIDESEIDFSTTISSTPTGNSPVYIDESELMEETSGITGAAKSGFDRLASGFYEIAGDEAKADLYMAQSKAYKSSVPSYKDINDPVDAFNYITENIATGAVYAPLMVASLPVAVPTGVGLAALEAGAMYNEQAEDAKSVVRAVSAAGMNLALERVGLGKFAGNSAIGNTLLNAVEEGGRGAATHLAAEVVGQGKSFEEAMANIDEAIVAGAATRVAMQPLEGRTASATDTITRPLEHRRATDIGSSTDMGIQVGDTARYMLDNIRAGYQADGSYITEEAVLRMIRQSNDENNTILAAQELMANGARLQPSSLDFDITVDRVVNTGTPEAPIPVLRPTIRNVARDYFHLTDRDMSVDRNSKWFEDKFSLPFLGSRLTGRATDYRTTQDARESIARKFEMDILQPFKDALTETYYLDAVRNNTPLDAEAHVAQLETVDRVIRAYVEGKGTLSDYIANGLSSKVIPDSGGQTFMDKVSQMKRVNQIADRMQDTTGQGEVGSVALSGIEAVATGGMPIASAITNLIGQGAVGFLSKRTRDQIKDVLEGNRKDGKKRVISEENKAMLIEQLAGLEAVLGRIGIDNSEEDPEEKYADLKML